MAVNGDEESLVELKGTRELLGELPHAFQQLIDDGGHLLWVPDLVVASVGWRGERGEQEKRGTLGSEEKKNCSSNCWETDLWENLCPKEIQSFSRRT